MVSALQSAASRRDSEAAKRIEEKNDLKADRFVGPVYDGTSHWAAFQVNTFRHAELYTSYSGIGDQAFKHGIHGVCTALAMVIPQWGPAKQPPLIKPKCPQQRNNKDCGLYAVAAMWYVAAGHNFDADSLAQQWTRDGILTAFGEEVVV